MAAPKTAIAPAQLPSLDRLRRDPACRSLQEQYGRRQLTTALREVLDRLRRQAVAGELFDEHRLAPASIATTVAGLLSARNQSTLKPLFNLTGTVVHTNLGRAALPESAVKAVAQVMQAPANLEFDLTSGRRGDRDALVEARLCELTGAEAATVVNNNAAAVLLMLNTLADEREVIVSRGELVEIGGSFRIPDVMRSAQAQLVEVGTTNRTHPRDYRQATGPDTALLMKVHTSNYVVQGFTAEVEVAQLADIAEEQGLPLVVDLGSGSLVDLADWGLPSEPTVRHVLDAGADVVTFSGDKLLGGPQAGIIAGRRKLIERIKQNPLKRALRSDKMTLAALEAILRLYQAPETLADNLTSLRQLTRPPEAMQAQAERLQPELQQAVGAAFTVTSTAMTSQIGSGALPSETLPSFGLAVHSHDGRGLNRLEAWLRGLPRPVVARLADQTLWLDLRCLAPDEEDELQRQIREQHS